MADPGEALRGREFNLVPATDPGVPHCWVGDYFPVRARDGRVLGVGGLMMDITERKQQEERLRQTAEFRERFLGVVSHDLRNPLNAILLSANALLRTEGIPASHTKMVRRIVTIPNPGSPDAGHDPLALARAGAALGMATDAAPDVEAAIARLQKVERGPQRILICGSLYLAGHVLALQEGARAQMN